MEEGSNVPYPHHKGAGVILPDCSRGVYTPFRLSAREKRELVKNLAEKGFQGIDEFLSKDRKEGAVKDRLDELRKKMESELDNIRLHRRRSLDDQIRQLTEQGKFGSRETDDGLMEESTFRRRSSEMIRGEVLANDLIQTLEGQYQPEERVERVGILRRIWSAIRRFFRRILSAILRFFRRLFRRDRKESGKAGRSRRKGAISLPFPSLDRDLRRWEEKMDRDLEKDKHLQKAVNQRLSRKTGMSSDRIEMKRSVDPEWYRNEAKKILEEEVRDTADATEKDIEEKLREGKKAKEEWGRKEKERRNKALELERAFDKEMKEKERTLEDMTKEEMKKELTSTLKNMGFLQKSYEKELEGAAQEWEITQALVEKFSEFIYSEIMEQRRNVRDQRGSRVSDAGVYEKAKLRMISEESRMDILQTIVNSRMNHPNTRGIDHHDMTVLKEVTTSEVLGIIIMDISGSMEENMRMEAAKRSVLALTQAIKRDNPRNRVDIIALSTRAQPISLKEVMTVEPRGFTNHQEAIALARSILDNSRADRNLLFLITDGLPEAYTDNDGKAVAGDLDRSMKLAIKEASGLLRYSNLSFNIFLLEPEDQDFIDSARKIAKAGEGNVIIADPRQLADRVLGSYQGSDKKLEGV